MPANALRDLVARLTRALDGAPSAPIRVSGLRGSAPALALARVIGARARPVTVVLASAAEAEAFAADLRFFLGERATTELNVSTPAIATRSLAPHQSDTFEHVEVVSQEVGLDPRQLTQLGGRTIRCNQLVDDRESERIAQRGVPRRPCSHRSISIHSARMSLNHD